MKQNYKISMYYDDYLIHYESLIAYELQSSDNSIIFYTNKESLEYLDINNINYVIEKNAKQSIKRFFIYKKFVLIILALGLFGAYLNSYRVQNIIFNIETPINNVIKEEIQTSYKKVLFFNFVNEDYESLAKDLRSRYSCYEWISINKNFDVIEVEIIKTGLDRELTDDLNGNIIATKDGVINSYLVHSGSVMIEKNDYVKKGDILIEGLYTNTVVSPKGVVLAHTFEEQTYIVEKEINDTILTGLTDKFYGINLFGNNINFIKDYKYSEYEQTKSTIFSIPFLFDIYKIEQFQKSDIIYINDNESAVEYGYSLVEENFIKNKVIDDEKIETSKLLNITEYDYYYEVTYLVKKLESIGEFEAI